MEKSTLLLSISTFLSGVEGVCFIAFSGVPKPTKFSSFSLLLFLLLFYKLLLFLELNLDIHVFHYIRISLHLYFFIV